MRKTCEDVMTPDPVCCVPGDTVQRAAQWMKELDIGAVPVCDSATTKKLVGIITDRDLALKVIAAGRDPKTTPVNEVMTTELFTCQPKDNIDQAYETMERQQVRRIPVVDRDGRIAGIIAQADLATRLRVPEKTAELVAEISRPATVAG